MKGIIERRHVGMPPEQVSYVVRLADGFVRLALLASGAVAKNPRIDTASFLKRTDITQMMDAMLGDARNRRALHVVAALSSVGWNGDREHEGMAIAKHFGLDWAEVRESVHQFHVKYGIAPLGGQLRYISPNPLGVFLMMEAMEANPVAVRTLPSVLPSEPARRAYYERLSSLVGAPNALPFAEKALAAVWR